MTMHEMENACLARANAATQSQRRRFAATAATMGRLYGYVRQKAGSGGESVVRGVLALAAGEPMPMGHLAADIDRTPVGASLLVDKFVERGLAVREFDPADRRTVLVRLTGKGLDLAMDIASVLDGHLLEGDHES